MLEYRLFCFDEKGGRSAERALCAKDDADAIGQIEIMQIGLQCELWERARFVVALPSNRGETT